MSADELAARARAEVQAELAQQPDADRTTATDEGSLMDKTIGELQWEFLMAVREYPHLRRYPPLHLPYMQQQLADSFAVLDQPPQPGGPVGPTPQVMRKPYPVHAMCRLLDAFAAEVQAYGELGACEHGQWLACCREPECEVRMVLES